MMTKKHLQRVEEHVFGMLASVFIGRWFGLFVARKLQERKARGHVE